jgi:hypothetical protein
MGDGMKTEFWAATIAVAMPPLYGAALFKSLTANAWAVNWS